MALKNETLDNFDVWLLWLKRFAYIGIVLTILVLISYFINFATWPLRMSSLTADWSAFGSLLAGISSFLGAIGTVGVMLLGIKQFKIQQKQIEKQQAYIKKQDSLIDFELFTQHREFLINILKRLEDKYKGKFKFNDTEGLYKKLFPDNKYILNTKKINKNANIITIFDSINELCNIQHGSNNYLSNLVMNTMRTFKLLDITKQNSPGDIQFKGLNTGVNILNTQLANKLLAELANEVVNFSRSNLITKPFQSKEVNITEFVLHDEYSKFADANHAIDIFFLIQLNSKQKIILLKIAHLLIKSNGYNKNFSKLLISAMNISTKGEASTFIDELILSLKHIPECDVKSELEKVIYQEFMKSIILDTP
jgi:hypothetical protein